MKRFFSCLIVVFILLNVCTFCLPLQSAENRVPDAVQETAEKELGDYRLRNIRQTTRDGETVYRVDARGRQNRKMEMYISPDGKRIEKIYEGQLSVVDNRLLRQGRPYRIRSIYTPQAGKIENAPKDFIQSISRMAYAGGNILAFDLYGLNEDGTAFTEEALDFFQTWMIDRICYADINCFCRVFNPDAPKNPEYRRNAVRTIAQYFAENNLNQILYWIDGPDAASLAKEFQSAAPDLIVAAPGADAEVTFSGQSPNSENPTIIIGDMPSDGLDGKHYLLKNNDENLQALDKMNARPEEKEPWNPDNSVLSEEEREEGFIALFDGKTTNGWISGGKGFVVNDGTLQRVPGSGTIRSVKRFDDFILRFDYKIEDRGNSGVQVRCPRSFRASKIGFEVQIYGDYGRPAHKEGTGSIYYVLAPTENASKPAGEWNSMEIKCDGPHVRVTLNSKVVQDVNFNDYPELASRLRDGFIHLTDHGAFVAYRNIRIKEL